MATTIPIAQAAFVNGSHQLLNQAVSGSSVTVALNRCTGATALQWAQVTAVIQVDVSVSYDGGNTFQDGGQFTAQGGIVLDADGVTQIPQTVATWQYLQPITNVVVTMAVTGGPLSTAGSIAVQ